MPYASSGDIELFYEDIGDGPAVLLIMGLGSQMVFWPPDFVEALRALGLRVIRYDSRDVGKSSHLDQLGPPRIGSWIQQRVLGRPVDAPYSLEDMAEDAKALLDHLRIDRAHVVGASMGGMVAQTFALEHPGRTASLTSIMSVDGSRRSLVGRPLAMKSLLGSAPTDAQSYAEKITSFMELVKGDYEIDRQALEELAHVMWDRGRTPAGVPRHVGAVLRSGSRRDRLQRVQAPTLVMHGSEDPVLLAKHGKSVADAIPEATWKVFEGMGHDIPEPLRGRMAASIAEVVDRGHATQP